MVLISGQNLQTEEEKRLQEDRERQKYWRRWGSYLSERQWATVREDYSHDGDAWSHFSHDQARSRAYRWGEDGIAGVSDNHGFLNVAFAFWNGQDPFLKERLFGLSNPQGNHGESVKEEYFHLDNTPSHAYMKFLYKYPQTEFPYKKLVAENARRSKLDKEYQLMDTGVFDQDNYWDIFVEVAKEADDPEELLFRVTAYNQGSEPAELHIVPHVWFRNTWAWGRESDDKKPSISLVPGEDAAGLIAEASHWKLGKRYIQLAQSPAFDSGDSDESGSAEFADIVPKFLFTENDTNYVNAFGSKDNKSPYVKDAFHEHIVDKKKGVVNPKNTGTKSCAWYDFSGSGGVPPGECAVVRFRLSRRKESLVDEELFDEIIEHRKQEADEFYYAISPTIPSDDLRNIQRQAFAGMLWCKQHYYFIWDQWANGDPSTPPPPPERKAVRNTQWRHMHIDNILSMPDSWEYPFFAVWDTAFHCIPLAMIDPDFAKSQLDLFTREWYMHPNGQIPAYEWNFSDVNPPVHAWSLFRTFKIERKMYGRQDIDFLERVFQKLLLNFTWWVNRKDGDGKNVFEGGFLGMDNIGVFNRSEPLPTGGVLEQADSTGWMAFYCLCMLNISLELAQYRKAYEDIASKFFEHFVLIADAMQYRTEPDGEEKSLWNETDGFYYDAIAWGSRVQQMPVMSLVGLVPMFATLTLEPQVVNRFPSFKKRLDWFIENKNDLAERNIASIASRGKGDRLLLSLMSKDRLKRTLERMLSEDHFLAPHGIRSMSKHHKNQPFSMEVKGQKFEVAYLPGDSDSGLFGGNSNWRGPIWFAPNFLLIESLQRFDMFYGDAFTIECPIGSEHKMHLGRVARELQHRLIGLAAVDSDDQRPINDGSDIRNFDPNWKDYVHFYEFFNGDNGSGLGATHQTGWTGLIAKLIHDVGISRKIPQTPRTPMTTGSHYFDDVFLSSDKIKPRRHTRRSSTARSVASLASATDELTMGSSITPAGGVSPRRALSRRNSALGQDASEREETQKRISDHVTSVLERYWAGQLEEYGGEGELEASADVQKEE